MRVASNADRTACPAHASTWSPPNQRLTTSAASRRRCFPSSIESSWPRVQEPVTADDVSAQPDPDTFSAALSSLSLTDVEETAGELHRRIAESLRELGERRADRGGRTSPRARVASLVLGTELAGIVLAGAAAGTTIELPRLDAHPSAIAAVMYAAPTLAALLARLDQDRRLLASLARTLESRLDEEHGSPWGPMPMRRLVTEVSIVHPARVAVDLDTLAGEADV